MCCFTPANTDSSGKLLTFSSSSFGKFKSEDGDACRVNGNDRVATAFAKFDLDNDGYLSWEEFSQFREVFIMIQQQLVRVVIF